MTTGTDTQRRAVVDRIKGDWLRDPCFDLSALDEIGDGGALVEFREELLAFEANHRAMWAAEAQAVHYEKLAKILARVGALAEPSPAQVHFTERLKVLAGHADQPGSPRDPWGAPIIRALAEEVLALEERLDTMDRLIATAHERLDQIGARRADSEDT